MTLIAAGLAAAATSDDTGEKVLTYLASAAFATIVVTIINAWSQRRALGAQATKTTAESDKTLTDAAREVQDMTLALIEPFREEITKLRTQVTELLEELDRERAKRRKAEDERDDAYDVIDTNGLPRPTVRVR